MYVLSYIDLINDLVHKLFGVPYFIKHYKNFLIHNKRDNCAIDNVYL